MQAELRLGASTRLALTAQAHLEISTNAGGFVARGRRPDGRHRLGDHRLVA
jgi:hypothetical protein